jgi:hypothetical protein
VKYITFTICSNNYLAQAIVLGNSVKAKCPHHTFLIILVDELNTEIKYNEIPFEVLPIHIIEPQIQSLVLKYNIIELNTSVKPGVIEYLFKERMADRVIYLDPDIKIYDDLTDLEEKLQQHTIVLTPHIFTPIPLDGKTPGENSFLNFGLYNLGFIGLSASDETDKFISWWKERTYKQGYNKVEDGIFVDQLYINLVPIFFKGVHILNHMGYNMAPWNLHERYLSQKDNVYWINEKDRLGFFHFSAFKINSNELPVHFYDRYSLQDRHDLQSLYHEYNTELINAAYLHYSKFKCVYVTKRNQYLQQVKKTEWKKKSWPKKIVLSVVKALPVSLKNRVSNSLISN